MALVRPTLAFLLVILLGLSGVLIAVAQDDTPTGSELPAHPWEGVEVVQPNGDLPGDPAIELVRIATGLRDPVNVATADDGSGRLFIVERVGYVRIVDENGDLLEEPFLDIRGSVKIDFLEQGLLGLAFHPAYAENGRFYVHYSDYRTNGDMFLVEYTVSADDPNRADPDSARVLMANEQPYVNHNGGTIAFGPDGYLYISLGDGGLAGDPYRTAQDVSNPLGAILRIDVDPAGDAPYAIPEDNPFAGPAGAQPGGDYLETGVLPSDIANQRAQDGSYVPNARPEIYFYGLRNAWQFTFDGETGDLFIADVGQNAWEEINFVPAGTGGGLNFGWPFMEGAHCYPPEAGDQATPVTGVEIGCPVVGIPPVAEYDHTFGCSITGLGVYRGGEFAELAGLYFASDFCSGTVWGLARDDGGAWQFQELLRTGLLVTGAGTSVEGDVYLTACDCVFGRDYDPFEDPNGTVWRVVAADQVPEGAETAPPPDDQDEQANDDEADAATPEANG